MLKLTQEVQTALYNNGISSTVFISAFTGLPGIYVTLPVQASTPFNTRVISIKVSQLPLLKERGTVIVPSHYQASLPYSRS
ncbi:hypothetical protein MS_041 [Vibrio phage VPMS1]|uniref:hypothetical protein n=1 Tax=Vibrio phage VPMS1 TaxID=1233488 RepID=UPI0003584067|nr:hypothetical protein MS_041 [Vibrio phage VPMS1]AFV51120.1 hypothetical protein MS_041 [Vibrio phage VPMS1]